MIPPYEPFRSLYLKDRVAEGRLTPPEPFHPFTSPLVGTLSRTHDTDLHSVCVIQI